LDREYLEDYEKRERTEIDRFLKRLEDEVFCFEKEKYPPDERFLNLKEPVAYASTESAMLSNVWAQIPFCGSLVLTIPPFPKETFEKLFFKTSDIPEIIDFIKKTGKLQIAFSTEDISSYVGLDYLDDFFKELRPPSLQTLPISLYGTKKEVKEAVDTFFTIGRVRYVDWIKELCHQNGTPHLFPLILSNHLDTYTFLKLGRYVLIEDIENSMVDDPNNARSLFLICNKYIRLPSVDTRFDLRNFTLEEIKKSRSLPIVYQPQTQFPCEIGKFLLKKLTYAPQGLDACKELMYNYDVYDLRRILESLNAAITENHPDLVSKNAEELSEILDNVWADKAILKRVENVKAGVPISIAAIGGIAGALVAGPAGAGLGGFLAGLGFKVAEKTAEKFYAVKGEGLSGNLAKLRTKSYQANIYDFKKKYGK